MRKIACLEKPRELCDLPNQDGFRFMAIMKDGTRVPCVVRKDEAGMHRAYDEKTGEWVYPRMAGWRQI